MWINRPSPNNQKTAYLSGFLIIGGDYGTKLKHTLSTTNKIFYKYSKIISIISLLYKNASNKGYPLTFEGLIIIILLCIGVVMRNL